MKLILVALSLVLVVSCKKKEDAPAPVVVEPTPVEKPAPTPEPTPEPTPVVKKNITCGGFEIGGEKEFIDAADLIAHAQAGNGNACISYHEHIVYVGDGFGPCITCVDINPIKYQLR